METVSSNIMDFCCLKTTDIHFLAACRDLEIQIGAIVLGCICVVAVWALTDYRVSISSRPDLPFDPADWDLVTLDVKGKVGWGLGWVSAVLNSGARFVGFYEVKFFFFFYGSRISFAFVLKECLAFYRFTRSIRLVEPGGVCQLPGPLP